MKTEGGASAPDNAKKLSKFHTDLQRWKSMLQFMEDEIIFIQRILTSYIFEPDTPNLFERLQDYLTRIKKMGSQKQEMVEATSHHESTLGGILECKDGPCDELYHQKHLQLQEKIRGFEQDFQILKSEIFNYAGGILKKRKPKI